MSKKYWDKLLFLVSKIDPFNVQAQASDPLTENK